MVIGSIVVLYAYSSHHAVYLEGIKCRKDDLFPPKKGKGENLA